MNTDGPADQGDHLAVELTPDQAREKRTRFLALYQSYAEADGKRDEDSESTDATLATFILPGD